MDALHLSLAALLSGLLALERKGFLQAMLARPLVAGALVGIALGRPMEGLGAGAALELFFLGAVNMGASLPDNELFASVAAVSCACALPSPLLPLPAALACATLLALPAAKLGRYVDRLGEQLNGWVASRAEGAGDPKSIRAGLRHNLYGLWMPFLAAALACLAGALVGGALMPLVLAHTPASLPRGLSLAWAAFLIVSAAAAARTARTAHAFVWTVIAAVVSAFAQTLGLLGAR
jgi:mannose/fructose/N-acetylgalactosamine-specific phosphotransferase system component IIC